MTKTTPKQIQRACDLVNAERGASHWTPTDYGRAAHITALADTIAKLDAETERADRATAARADRETADIECLRGILSVTQAERDKARADLGEIDALLDGQPPINSSLTDAQAIVAPYRVETDPLVAEAKAIVDKHTYTYKGLRNAAAEALTRGHEIGRPA